MENWHRLRKYKYNLRFYFTNDAEFGACSCQKLWINTHMLSKVWDEIINPFQNFNVSTVEV